MPTKTILLQQVRTDGHTQSRVTIHEGTVCDYADAMKGGAKFPPPVVFHDGTAYWLADGFHRVMALQRLGKKNIPAEVKKGTRRDAQLFSVGANANHGLRRSNEDKRKCVMMLLQDAEWGKWSDGKISDAAGVSQPFVSDLRKQLETHNGYESGTRIGRDGIERKVPSKAPERPASPSRPEAEDKPRNAQPGMQLRELAAYGVKQSWSQWVSVLKSLATQAQFRKHHIDRDVRDLFQKPDEPWLGYWQEGKTPLVALNEYAAEAENDAGTSARSKAPTRAPERPQPKQGKELEYSEVAEALAQTQTFRDIVNETHALRRKIAELAKTKAGAHLGGNRLQDVEASCKNIVRIVEFAVPFKACPQMPNCRSGCKVCGGACFVTEEIWKRIPEDERA
jgi:hypothetical protein